MKTLIVNEKYDGKKLNIFLQDKIVGLSTGTLYKALRKKDIKVNNKRISQNVTVNSGDKVDVYIDDTYLYNNIKLDIVYEDDNIVLVNKPAGIEVTGNNGLEGMLNYMPCHRLDRNTFRTCFIC